MEAGAASGSKSVRLGGEWAELLGSGAGNSSIVEVQPLLYGKQHVVMARSKNPGLAAISYPKEGGASAAMPVSTRIVGAWETALQTSEAAQRTSVVLHGAKGRTRLLEASGTALDFEIVGPLKIRGTTGPPRPWLRSVLESFADVMQLPAGWDSYGAAPPSREAAVAAFTFLVGAMAPTTSPPSIVPMSDGGIQLEWHRNGLDVEIDFPSDGPPVLYVAEASSETEWEGQPDAGFEEFHLAERLSGAVTGASQ